MLLIPWIYFYSDFLGSEILTTAWLFAQADAQFLRLERTLIIEGLTIYLAGEVIKK